MTGDAWRYLSRRGPVLGGPPVKVASGAQTLRCGGGGHYLVNEAYIEDHEHRVGWCREHAPDTLARLMDDLAERVAAVDELVGSATSVYIPRHDELYRSDGKAGLRRY
jgi:hypothetical protein